MKRLLAVAALALAVTSCSSEPDVPASLKQRVAVFVEDGNCQGLQAEFDRAEAADWLEYIDAAMSDLGCYG